jgi:hypothetical protein
MARKDRQHWQGSKRGEVKRKGLYIQPQSRNERCLLGLFRLAANQGDIPQVQLDCKRLVSLPTPRFLVVREIYHHRCLGPRNWQIFVSERLHRPLQEDASEVADDHADHTALSSSFGRTDEAECRPRWNHF